MHVSEPSADDGRVIAIECNGARAAIRVSRPELLPAVLAEALPLGWSPTRPLEGDRTFGLAAEPDGTYVVSEDGAPLTRHPNLETGVGGLRSCVFMHVISTPRERLFVHAACAGHRGVAILLPATSSAGKTTLVAALLRAGAAYYTDDYAPIDAEGRVHPYPLPLWIAARGGGFGRPWAAEELGATVASAPAPVAVVAELTWRDGAAWDVRRCGAAEAALLVLGHAVNPQHDPDFALPAVRRAVTGAIVLRGERGDADEAAAKLLALAEEAAGPASASSRPSTIDP